ncbi:MAG: DUF424 family protein [Candidatus Diapherotrites archaeon]|nr:DUF424 family protein [Candidatus Diapherotrites archaeon]
MYATLIETGEAVILFCCDDELLGKKLVLKGTEIEIKKETYGQKKASEKETAEMLKRATTANIFGEKSVQIAVKLGLSSAKNVKKIQGIPHLQIYTIG